MYHKRESRFHKERIGRQLAKLQFGVNGVVSLMLKKRIWMKKSTIFGNIFFSYFKKFT